MMPDFTPHNDLQVEVSNRQILKIALPIALAMLVPQLNFQANTIFLSRLGERELGAAGIAGVYHLVFALIGNGLNSGLQALIARRAGENRPLEIGRMYAQSIWIALLLAAVGIIITTLFGEWLISSTLQDSKVQSQVISFMKIRIWGLPFLFLFQIGNALFVGTNTSRFMKYGFFFEALLNIFLDYALIFGHFGLPRLGFNGAAIASIIAEACGLAVVMIIIFKKRFHTRFSLFTQLAFDKKLSGLIFRQSSPLVLQYVLSVGVWFAFYILIEHYGQRSLAISNTMRNVFSFFGIFIWGFANTSNAMVSNIIGQGKKEQVLSLINKIARISLLSCLCIGAVVNIFPQNILGFFSADPGFTEAGVPALRVVTLGILMMSVGTVWLNAVTGTANTRINLGIEIIAIILYGIYIYFVLHKWKLSLEWAWTSELLYWFIIWLLAYLYLKSGKWKNKVI
jgi:multidrug resistance protein, MATE family